MQRGTTIDYFDQDGIGSVTSLTVQPAQLHRATYDSFGNLASTGVHMLAGAGIGVAADALAPTVTGGASTH